MKRQKHVCSLGLLQKTITPGTWHKPMEGFYKANWDASLDKVERRMGMGIVVRDHKGTLQATLCATMDFVSDLTIAEALAAQKAAKLVQN